MNQKRLGLALLCSLLSPWMVSAQDLPVQKGFSIGWFENTVSDPTHESCSNGGSPVAGDLRFYFWADALFSSNVGYVAISNFRFREAANHPGQYGRLDGAVPTDLVNASPCVKPLPNSDTAFRIYPAGGQPLAVGFSLGSDPLHNGTYNFTYDIVVDGVTFPQTETFILDNTIIHMQENPSFLFKHSRIALGAPPPLTGGGPDGDDENDLQVQTPPPLPSNQTRISGGLTTSEVRDTIVELQLYTVDSSPRFVLTRSQNIIAPGSFAFDVKNDIEDGQLYGYDIIVRDASFPSTILERRDTDALAVSAVPGVSQFLGPEGEGNELHQVDYHLNSPYESYYSPPTATSGFIFFVDFFGRMYGQQSIPSTGLTAGSGSVGDHSWQVHNVPTPLPTAAVLALIFLASPEQDRGHQPKPTPPQGPAPAPVCGCSKMKIRSVNPGRTARFCVPFSLFSLPQNICEIATQSQFEEQQCPEGATPAICKIGPISPQGPIWTNALRWGFQASAFFFGRDKSKCSTGQFARGTYKETPDNQPEVTFPQTPSKPTPFAGDYQFRGSPLFTVRDQNSVPDNTHPAFDNPNPNLFGADRYTGEELGFPYRRFNSKGYVYWYDYPGIRDVNGSESSDAKMQVEFVSFATAPDNAKLDDCYCQFRFQQEWLQGTGRQAIGGGDPPTIAESVGGHNCTIRDQGGF